MITIAFLNEDPLTSKNCSHYYNVQSYENFLTNFYNSLCSWVWLGIEISVKSHGSEYRFKYAPDNVSNDISFRVDCGTTLSYP